MGASCTSTRTRPRPARTPAPAALLIAGLLAIGSLIAGCGGSNRPSASRAAAQQRTQEQTAETKFEDFARCLREHGIEAEPRSGPGGIHGLKINAGDKGPAEMQAAERACARYRPPAQQKGGEPPQAKVEHEEALQKLARCLRGHGIEAETSPSGGVFIHARSGSGGLKPESPAFKAAQEACSKLVPGGAP